MEECDICDDKFETPQALGAHKGLSHTGNPEVCCYSCGKKFEKTLSKVKKHERHFCSERCRSEWLSEEHNGAGKRSPSWCGGKEKVECSGCGKIMERYPSHILNNAVCSERCLSDLISKQLSGKNNPNWENGKEKYYGPNWEKIREKVIQRDDEKCQCCNMGRDECAERFGCDLHVHHIKRLKSFDNVENANRLSNLQTLCPSCHKRKEAL